MTIDLFYHDRYVVIVLWHIPMAVAMLFVAYAAVALLFTKVTGRALSIRLGYAHLFTTVIYSHVCRGGADDP